MYLNWRPADIVGPFGSNCITAHIRYLFASERRASVTRPSQATNAPLITYVQSADPSENRGRRPGRRAAARRQWRVSCDPRQDPGTVNAGDDFGFASVCQSDA